MNSNSTIYQRLGVPTIVNAKGTSTRLSGGVMDARVAAAMAEASQHCVNMLDLHARASEIFADATGAESGLATSGAAAGLLLGTAACIAGLDVAKMDRLPATVGLRNEVIVPINQRNVYNRSIQAAGGKIVEAGLSDRVAGAGVRDVEAWEVEASINENTAAILYLARPDQKPPLSELVVVAKKHNIPLMVDAASQLPPAENLQRFIVEGADLVVFSGGKVLGGPQASGILVGRRDLVASAALQMLDHDVLFSAFNPPARFIDKRKIAGLPRNGIGRSCKVGKEEIVGLLVALEVFLESNDEARRSSWRATMDALLKEFLDIACIQARIVSSSYKPGIPGVEIVLDQDAAGIAMGDFIARLGAGDPSIHVDVRDAAANKIVFAPVSLRPGDTALIGQKVRSILEGR